MTQAPKRMVPVTGLYRHLFVKLRIIYVIRTTVEGISSTGKNHCVPIDTSLCLLPPLIINSFYNNLIYVIQDQ